MMPGLGANVNMSQIKEVEVKLKKNKAIIRSMTIKERMNPDLLISDKTARSRLIRVTKGSGTRFDEGQQFVSDFQRMRTMMSRMQKQMGGQMDPNAAIGPGGAQDAMAAIGNRAMRRTAKKKGKAGKSGGGGFG